MSRSAAASVVRLLPSVSRPLSLGLLLAAVLQPAFGFGFMLATGVLVGHIPDALRSGVRGVLLLSVVCVGVCFAGQQVVAAAMSVVQTVLGRRLDNVLADRLMRAQLRPRGIAHLEDATTQSLAERAAGGLGGARWRPAEAPGALAALTSGGLGVALACAAVMWLSWWLGILLAVAVVWCARELYAHLLRMTLDATEVEHTADYRRLSYEYDVVVSPASAKEIRVFGFAPWLLDRVQCRSESLLGFDLRRMGHLGIGEVASLTALVVVVGGGFAVAGSRVIDGELSLGAAVVLAQALIAPLAHLAGVFQALIDVRQSTRPVPALLQLEEQMTTGQSVEAPTPSGRMAGGEIRFCNVAFHYRGTNQDVLCGLDLRIPAGSSLAVVGLNGAGKTTLIKLLCRFYDPTGGSITVGGIDLRDQDWTGWQQQIAAIFQDFARFPFTAADNVRVGHLNASDRQIEQAAATAGAHEMITSLPAGWDTPLSRELSGGSDLSGGQWQRLALARALLARDRGAGLLILDEPAANLDVRAEAELNDRFLDLTRGCTTIVVSHRFSTVRRADRICVLEHGRVAELGTHAELVAVGGRYARMFGLQAARFR